MGRVLYWTSVSIAAMGLFWPVLYGNVPALRKIPGDPLVQALIMIVLFGVLAYSTYGEEIEKTRAS
ncbi:hypothetical protein [Thermococcus gorgonarius]|uniref:Uncharacterized protein n=1 Tax=Thermococcus gorgonarius TaxID=71997 RepID=A0A2Z2ME84_THEGO|nr:hypothetical protein [Thermococcus gorgonarius]ASJ00771.1 hypothetical protein A3K92_04380 [Thermococcus gorgonarius]